jgi:hypothetical protein
VSERRELLAYGIERGRVLEEQEQGYQWIREHAGPQDRIIAYEDPLLYLYTGRQAARPATISPAFVYLGRDDSLWRDADHIADTAHSIGARYWMTTGNDFVMEGNTGVIAERMMKIKGALPQVFQSSSGSVQIYDSGCAANPQSSRCAAPARVLFPAR